MNKRKVNPYLLSEVISENIDRNNGYIVDDGIAFKVNDLSVRLSEGLAYHVENNRPLHDPIYRPDSRKYYDIIQEARILHDSGLVEFPYDPWLLEEDVGQYSLYNGVTVPLDLPIMIGWRDEEAVNEEKKKKDPPLNKPMNNTGGGKKWKVYVRNPATGKVKKITFGDKKGGLKGNWNDPEARKNFASRHNCAKKTNKLTAGYWACRAHKYFGKNVPGRFW